MPVPPPKFVRRHACRTGCIAAAHTCVRHLAGNLLAAVRRTLFLRARAQKYALRTSTDFLNVRLWRSQIAQLSALPTTVSTHTVLPWLSLVSLRPSGLVRRLSQSRTGTPLWELSCTSCDDGCTPPPHVLPWRTAPGSTHPPLLSSQCQPSHKLSSSCSSWRMSFPDVHHARGLFLCSLSFSWTDTARIHFASFCLLLLFPRLPTPAQSSTQLLFHCSGQLRCTHVPICSILSDLVFSGSHQREHVDACLCIFFVSALSTCRALVTVRMLALTNIGPPSSHAAHPKHAQICH